MPMTVNELKSLVAEKLMCLHPEVKVVFQEGDYGPNDILVFVYNVEDELVEEVEDQILDFDWNYCRDNGASLTPHVKSATITERFYPQHKLPGNDSLGFCMPTAIDSPGWIGSERKESNACALVAESNIWDRTAWVEYDANEELALAA